MVDRASQSQLLSCPKPLNLMSNMTSSLWTNCRSLQFITESLKINSRQNLRNVKILSRKKKISQLKICLSLKIMKLTPMSNPQLDSYVSQSLKKNLRRKKEAVKQVKVLNECEYFLCQMANFLIMTLNYCACLFQQIISTIIN